MATSDASWCDGPSPGRSGWRERSATVCGEPVFAVDYVVCADCGLGWVEQPFTSPRYQRRGLARAGFEELRKEHLGWHGTRLGSTCRSRVVSGWPLPTTRPAAISGSRCAVISEVDSSDVSWPCASWIWTGDPLHLLGSLETRVIGNLGPPCGADLSS
ncbi:hypothetical protein RAM_31690 [Amycolatopsis mediterranei S699]|uniref:Uncharacterized protein n=1 Tax=Amycolatopsis mediterranei (strain S699) TaxID=713604 RepID=A0A9R0P1X6_AMYMS|nr:hypothetical protein RAM_31690 [Amycolatopsis mediterranei S699]